MIQNIKFRTELDLKNVKSENNDGNEIDDTRIKFLKSIMNSMDGGKQVKSNNFNI